MSKSGKIYNGSSGAESVGVYVNTATAPNIQNSLKNYREGGRFRNIAELYDKWELTSAINRIIEDMNHAFTVKVLTREFRSNDFASSVSNAKNDRTSAVDVAAMVDMEPFTDRLKKLLDILNISEQTMSVSVVQAREIKEYLILLDLVCEVDCIDVSRGGYVQDTSLSCRSRGSDTPRRRRLSRAFWTTRSSRKWTLAKRSGYSTGYVSRLSDA